MKKGTNADLHLDLCNSQHLGVLMLSRPFYMMCCPTVLSSSYLLNTLIVSLFNATYHAAGRARMKQSEHTQGPEKHSAKDLTSINKSQQKTDIKKIFSV